MGAEFVLKKKALFMAIKLTGKKKEAFTYFAPSADAVQLVGDFTGWDQKPITLKKQKDGTWKGTVSLPRGAHEYRYVVDGQWSNDPLCQVRRTNPFGAENCVREVK